MQITSITVENFRSIASIELTDLTFGTLIAGFNDSGKSNLLNAVRYCLYGHCEYTDRRGAGYARLVAHGQMSAEVRIRFRHGDHDILAMCSVTRKGQEFSCVTADTGEVFAETRQLMYQALGIDEDHAEMGAAMASYLDAGFDRIINAYLAETIPVFDVLKHSGSHNKWLEAWLLKHGFKAESYPPEQWREIGASIYGARTEVNRECKDLQRDIDALGFVAAPVDGSGREIPVEKLQACKQHLASQEGLRSQLLVELGGCGDRRAADAIAADLEKRRALLANAEARVSESRDALATTERALNDAATELRELRNRESTLRGQRLELETKANRFKDGQCDKCGSKLSKAALGKLVGDSLELLTQNKSEQAAVATEIQRVQLAINETQTRIDTLRLEFGAAETDRQRLATECGVLQREQPAGRTRDEVQGDIDYLDARIQTGRDIVTRLEKLANHAGMSARLAERQAEAEHMSYFCKALRDGELINRLSQGDKKTELLARINAELKPMGYVLDIRQDGKSLTVLMARLGGTFDPLRECSTSMQWLAQFALAIGFAAGGPVVLDNLDHLDGRNREHVRKRLRTVAGTVLLAMAWNGRDAAGAEIVAAFAPARLVWIDGGRVVKGKEVAA